MPIEKKKSEQTKDDKTSKKNSEKKNQGDNVLPNFNNQSNLDKPDPKLVQNFDLENSCETKLRTYNELTNDISQVNGNLNQVEKLQAKDTKQDKNDKNAEEMPKFNACEVTKEMIDKSKLKSVEDKTNEKCEQCDRCVKCEVEFQKEEDKKKKKKDIGLKMDALNYLVFVILLIALFVTQLSIWINLQS